MEVLLDAALGAIVGCFYVWPFRASYAYLQANRGPWAKAPTWALLKKVVSLVVALFALLVTTIALRTTAVKSREWLDLAVFLFAAMAAFAFVWRRWPASPSKHRLERPGTPRSDAP
jgi:phosphoglycerol transferase MdoB-like AlkP superfamily enzyme